jgi:hypothetical protein
VRHGFARTRDRRAEDLPALRDVVAERPCERRAARERRVEQREVGSEEADVHSTQGLVER